LADSEELSFNDNTGAITSKFVARQRAIKFKFIQRLQKLRVVFFCDQPFNWDCLASVYTAFRESREVDVSVVTSSRRVRDVLSTEGITAKYVFGDYARIESAIKEAHCVFTSHPRALAPFVVEEDRCRIVYIPYGMTISAASYSETQQHDLWIHNRAWRIVAGSDYHKGLFEKFCSRGGLHVVALGNPKWDLLSEARPVPGKRRFLWNIHYSLNLGDGKKWSTWNDYGRQILSVFRELPDIVLVVRPHPGFFRKLQERGLAQEVRELIAATPNAVLDETPSPVRAITSCAAMLTDGSSMIYDFAVTGKPLLYLRTAECEKLHSHAFGLVSENFTIGDRPERLQSFIDSVLQESDAKTTERRAKIGRYIGYVPTRPVGSLICDYVLANINQR
jgi:hypothetical protein